MSGQGPRYLLAAALVAVALTVSSCTQKNDMTDFETEVGAEIRETQQLPGEWQYNGAKVDNQNALEAADANNFAPLIFTNSMQSPLQSRLSYGLPLLRMAIPSDAIEDARTKRQVVIASMCVVIVTAAIAITATITQIWTADRDQQGGTILEMHHATFSHGL
jgi:hypothetical protein